MVKNKIAQRAVAAGLTGLMAFGAAAPAALATGIQWKDFSWASTDGADNGTYWKRIGGSDRYETMKKIVEAYNEYEYYNWISLYGGKNTKEVYNQHTTAVLASGDNFPDALAANGLAGYLSNEKLTTARSLAGKNVSGAYTNNVPVILTKAGSLSSQAKDLLKNMQVQDVIIMGGTAAVSQDVENALNDMGIGTQRVAGKDRQETSLKALQRINGNWNGRKGTYDLIIATGDNYADALSISPYAYRMGTPVILTKKDGTLTDDQVAAIKKNDKIREIVIVGGTAAVSDAVMGQIGTLRDNGQGVSYTRLAGADRYETSAKIAEFEIGTWYNFFNSNPGRDTFYNGSIWSTLGVDNGFRFNHAVVATGENFPDALAGGQLAGGANIAVDDFGNWNPCPLLLVKDGNTQAERVIEQQLAANRTTIGTNDFVTSADWAKVVENLWANGSAEYKALLSKYGATSWLDYYDDAYSSLPVAARHAAALEDFPFYVSIDGLIGVNEQVKAVTQSAPFYFNVDGFNIQDKKLVFTTDAGSDSSLLKVDYKKVDEQTGDLLIGFHLISEEKTDTDGKTTWPQCEIKVDHGTGLPSTNNGGYKFEVDYAVITEPGTYTFKLQWNDRVKGDVIASADVIRYVGTRDGFYGIILGGTSAVSNDKRDKLDDAVAFTASEWNVDADGMYWGKDKDYRIWYNRLVYMPLESDATKEVFSIAGTLKAGGSTGDRVVYDIKNDTWTYVFAN